MTLSLGNNPSLSWSGSAVHPLCPFNAGIRHVSRQYGFVLCYKVSLFTCLAGLFKSPGLVKSRHCEVFYPKHLASLRSAFVSQESMRFGSIWFGGRAEALGKRSFGYTRRPCSRPGIGHVDPTSKIFITIPYHCFTWTSSVSHLDLCNHHRPFLFFPPCPHYSFPYALHTARLILLKCKFNYCSSPCLSH